MQGKRNNPFYQAQAILSRRSHTEAEMKQKLRRKGFSPSQVEKVVAWLYEQKLLNDELYAEQYVESILAGKPVGRRWLEAKLRQRGVPVDLIGETLDKLLPAEREVGVAKEAVVVWQRRQRGKELDQEKLMRFLSQRGFSFESISKARKLPSE